MAQRPVFSCDGGCGEEIGVRGNPVLYLVVGTTDHGRMDAAVRLPPQVWAVLQQAVPRRDYCPACFAAAFGTGLVTLAEYELAAAPPAARPDG